MSFDFRRSHTWVVVSQGPAIHQLSWFYTCIAPTPQNTSMYSIILGLDRFLEISIVAEYTTYTVILETDNNREAASLKYNAR
jgi:hypothetical protein